MNAYDFFDSIGIIVDAKLKELSMDRTIIGTIIDDSKKNEGLYTIEYDSSTIRAVSNDTSFKNKDLVYVGIPQGNYANAFIIAKKPKEEKVNNTKDPFYNFIKEIKITPNSSKWIKESKGPVNIQNLSSSNEIKKGYYFTNYNNFSKVGISFDYLISEESEGAYGLTFVIEQLEKSGDLEKIVNSYYSITLNEMYPSYVANSIKTVNCLFDISDLKNISCLYFNAFNDSSSSLNINNLNVYFGNLIDDYTTEEFVLYTEDIPEYDSNNEIPVYYRWVYKDNGELKIITSQTEPKVFPKNATLKWGKKNTELEEQEDKPWQLKTNSINLYKEYEEYTAHIVYNSIEADDVLNYEAGIKIKNKKTISIFNDVPTIRLEANKDKFDNVYHPDGTILDFSLVMNNEDYKLRFSDNPFSQEFINSDIDKSNLDFKIEYKISDSKTNIQLYKGSEAPTKTIETELNLVNDVEKQFALGEKTWWPADENKRPNFIISENYFPINNKNDIVATITVSYNGEEVARFERVLSLSFRRAGICETDYILYPIITDELGQPARSIRANGGILNIRTALCNSQGEEVEFNGKVDWAWYQRTASEDKIVIQTFDESSRSCRLVSNINIDQITPNSIASDEYNYVLKATYTGVKENSAIFQAICYMPIGINASYDNNSETYAISYLGGPTSIVYNSNGGLPSYYSTPYKIFTEDKIEYQSKELRWNILLPSNIDKNTKTLYPHLVSTDNAKSELVAPDIFTTSAETGAIVIAILGDKVLWIQPLVSYQSKSFSSYINDWDGSLHIDKNNGSIMTPRLGAGKKNDDGTYSGVLLGDWAEEIEDGSWKEELTGLYGYDHGAQSYGFKEDGSAFIGKSGTGRINFNGDQGMIFSGNYDGKIQVVNFYYHGKDSEIIQKDTEFKVLNYICNNSGNPCGIRLPAVKYLCSLERLKIEFNLKIENITKCDLSIRNFIDEEIQNSQLNNNQTIKIVIEPTKEELESYARSVDTPLWRIYLTDGNEYGIYSTCNIIITDFKLIQDSNIILTTGFDGVEIQEIIDSNYFNSNSLNYLDNNSSTKGTLLDLKNGNLFTNNGNFRGHLNAKSGYIGGWNIKDNYLISDEGAGICGQKLSPYTEITTFPDSYISCVTDSSGAKQLQLNTEQINGILDYLIKNNGVLKLKDTYHYLKTGEWLRFIFGLNINSAMDENEKKNKIDFLKNVCAKIKVLDLSELTTIKIFSDTGPSTLASLLYYAQLEKIIMPLTNNNKQFKNLFREEIPSPGEILSSDEKIFGTPQHSSIYCIKVPDQSSSIPYLIPSALQEIIINKILITPQDDGVKILAEPNPFTFFRKVTINNYDDIPLKIQNSLAEQWYLKEPNDAYYYIKDLTINGNVKIDLLDNQQLFSFPNKSIQNYNTFQGSITNLALNCEWENIPENFCSDQKQLITLVLPSFSAMGKNCFSNCDNLSSVLYFARMSDKELKLGANCFSGSNQIPYIVAINQQDNKAIKEALPSTSSIPVKNIPNNTSDESNGFYTQSGEVADIILWSGGQEGEVPTLTKPASFMILSNGDIVVDRQFLSSRLLFLQEQIITLETRLQEKTTVLKNLQEKTTSLEKRLQELEEGNKS